MEDNEMRYTFIVAEPSLDMQRFIGFCIKSYGNIIPAYTATALFKKLEANKVDIIISEIDHWDMDADELYKKIQEEYQDIPVILITSRSVFEVKQMTSIRDSDARIHKPFQKELLVETVRHVIESLKK